MGSNRPHRYDNFSRPGADGNVEIARTAISHISTARRLRRYTDISTLQAQRQFSFAATAHVGALMKIMTNSKPIRIVKSMAPN
jgi:hypothetical protein